MIKVSQNGFEDGSPRRTTVTSKKLLFHSARSAELVHGGRKSIVGSIQIE